MRVQAKQNGFTLIEVLVAMIVLAVGLVALARFQADALTTGAFNKTRNEALGLAQDTLDRLRNQAVADTRGGDYFGLGYDALASGSQTVTGTAARFTVAWTVTDNAAVPADPPYATVSVTVSWDDAQGKAQQVQLTTNVAGLPPSHAPGALAEAENTAI